MRPGPDASDAAAKGDAPRGASTSKSCIASLILHVAVACVLIFTIFPEERVPPPIQIQSLPVTEQPVEEIQFVELPLSSSEELAPTVSGGGQAATDIVAAPSAGFAEMQARISTSTEAAADGEVLAMEYPFNAGILNSVVTGSGGDDGGGGEGSGAGYGVSFYGVRAKGRRVAFVADCSSSMSGGRLEALNRKLAETVQQLDPRVEFAIVFFSHQPFVMPDLGMAPATPDNKKAYLEWASSMRPDGGTEPSAAMEAALKLRPSLVFFLTDGTFVAERTLSAIKRFRHSPNVPIYTIAIGRESDFAVLQQIAVATGGRFRQVIE